ncbi:MAG TPA: type II toxin-antitoxin system Phd/YefM family antitoxin [Thermoanaerobaculia bacterium]|nr:type II toxin-antitoxin system Phd/YefM family antitoxin [Thermoanaerobaculia bacterium]
MSNKINISDAKTEFSKLVAQAEAGEEIIITRAGRPAAKLVPFRSTAVKRKPGRMRGRIRLGRDFDASLPPGMFEND